MTKQAQFFTVTILGCGSSGGVPRIGGVWGNCDPINPKNRRRRCSILIQAGRYDSGGGVGEATKGCNGDLNKNKTTNILIDSGCDIREQLLDAKVTHLDAVFYTHEHADHVHGIDDLRVIAMSQKKRIETYMAAASAKRIMSAFSYCFTTPVGSDYKPILNANLVESGKQIQIDGAGGTLAIMPFLQQHGNIISLGYRVADFAYSCDLSELPKSSHELLDGVKIWVLDALRYKTHPCHLNVEQAVSLIEELDVSKAYLTNLHIDLDYKILKKELPKHIRPAYDGLEIKMDID